MQIQIIKNKDDESIKWFGASLALHISILLIFALKMTFFKDSSPIEFQSAVRVDLVALPDKIVSDLPSEPTEPTEPQAAVKNEAKSEPIKETIKEQAIEKLKEQTKPPKNEAINLEKKNKAIEKLKALQKLEAEAKKESATKGPAKPLKGNVLSAGSAIRGVARLEYDAYIGSIDSRVKAQWFLPEWLSNKDLKASVLVLIDESGQLKSKKLVRSSGNSSYDTLALDSIDRAAPFNAPPEKFLEIVGEQGIVFQFP